MTVREEIPFGPQSSRHVESISHELYTETYEYSLKRYGKAIQSMRSALSDENIDVQKALIACLLVFCFEMQIGNHASAVRHAQSGTILLHQWQTKKGAFQKASGKTVYTVEDEIVQTIERLDLQILIFLDLRPLAFHQTMTKYLSTVLQNMPRVFMTLKEAKTWCEWVMRQNYHFRAEACAVGNAHEVDASGPPIQWEGSVEFPMKANILSAPKEVPSHLLLQYQALLSQWNRWSMAFRLLLTSLRVSKHNDQVAGKLLLIQAKMSCISLAAAFSTLETAYDALLPEFQEIMSLVVSVHDTLVMNVNLGGRLLYRFDGGIIPALFFAATKCRNRMLRRQAIGLLSSRPWREGVFDSPCCQKMATWAMEVEEEGLGEDEVIPEHRRLRIRRSHIDLQRRRVHLTGTQFKTANDTEPCWREIVMTW
jgi:hypothetical protein